MRIVQVFFVWLLFFFASVSVGQLYSRWFPWGHASDLEIGPCKRQEVVHVPSRPNHPPRDFNGSTYVHAFQTVTVKPGSQHDFSDPDFLANQITEENGCEVSTLEPEGNWLKVKIVKSRRAIKRYKHKLRVAKEV
ncbi:hypothetical protein DFH29DRAFT_882643 [Suillus ampliporus]|nr:hypothetical protein DFH29DRAFT_882643 [Suillus ampliporus]